MVDEAGWQAIVAAVDAVAIGIGLAIVGVPLVLPLSVLVFLLAFIPLVGATLAGVLCALVALVALSTASCSANGSAPSISTVGDPRNPRRWASSRVSIRCTMSVASGRSPTATASLPVSPATARLAALRSTPRPRPCS